MTPEVLISVEGVSRKFCRDLGRSLRYAVSDTLNDLWTRRRPEVVLRRDEFWALRGVSFEVRRGESVGVMGVNGAGKTTLLRIVLGALRLSEGRTVTRGRVAALSEHGLGFDPVLTGRENVYMSAAVLDIDRRRVDEAFDQIVGFAGVEDFIDSPVRVYSTGMRARLGFSVAMHLEPDILLVDEVLAVGDIGFQRRCIQHAQRYLDGGGSLVLVSHNPLLVQFLCDRCLVLDRGTVVFDGNAVEGVARYLRAAQAAAGDVAATDPALVGLTRTTPVPPAADVGVVIESFGIEPVDSAALITGGAARIYVRYRSARNLDVRWGFSLLTPDLATTISCDGPRQSCVIPAGAGELTGTLPRLPLAGGRYAIRVAIMDPNTELPFALRGYHDAPGSFTVEMPASIRNNYRMFTSDLVALEDLQWDQRALDASPPN